MDIGNISIIILFIVLLMYNTAPVEQFTGNNDAEIVMFADDHLHIYHDSNNTKTLIGRAYCCNKVYKFIVPNFNNGDRILFNYKNTGGPGYITGHMKWKGEYYPTNNINITCNGVLYKNSYIAAGRRVGCYKDGPSRRLPYSGGRDITNEQCRNIAMARKHKYYGLQYGGECYTGNDLSRATSYGKLPDSRCAMKGKNAMTRWTQRQGGGWANDIHNTFEPPKVRICGRAWESRYIPLAKKYLHPEAMIIKSEQGPSCQHSELDWVQFQWKPKEIHVDKVQITSYCPDSTYTEFNAGACNDPSSTYSCTNTAKQNYQADMNQCQNKYSISSNHYDNTDFYSLIYQSWKNSKPRLQTKHKFVTQFTQQIKNLLRISCTIQKFHDIDRIIEKCIDIDRQKLDIHMFYRHIITASKLCKKKNTNINVCAQFNDSLLEFIRIARIIIFIENTQTSCTCKTGYSMDREECCKKVKWGTCVKGCKGEYNKKYGSRNQCAPNNTWWIPFDTFARENCESNKCSPC